jgi:hypothetical protein
MRIRNTKGKNKIDAKREKGNKGDNQEQVKVYSRRGNIFF